MKKFIGGVVLGFLSGVVGTVAWAFKEVLKKEAGRKKVGRLLRDISAKIDGAADRLEDSGEEKTANSCGKCDNPYMEPAEPKFDRFDICGRPVLFSDVRGELEEETERVTAETAKRDYFLYWLRDDGCGGKTLTLESSPVFVNYFGTVLSKFPLDTPEGEEVMDLRDEDWGWRNGMTTVREFLKD